MGIPVWSPGEVLAAADVNSWFVPLAAYKAADTSRSNAAGMSADPDLTLPVAANAAYSVWCYLNYEGSSTASQALQFQLLVPASAILRYHCVYKDTTGANLTDVTYTSGTTVHAATSGSGTLKGVSINGLLTVSSTAGSLTLQWAQNVSEPAAVTLHANSKLLLQRVG